MRKRWRNVLTLVSLIVCVASASLVSRSFVREDSFERAHRGGIQGVRSVDGKLLLWQWSGDFVVEGWKYYSESRGSPFAEQTPRQWAGVVRLGAPWGLYPITEMLVLPLWLVPIVMAIPPLRWWRKRRKEGGRGFAVNAAATVDNDSMIR